MTKLSKSFVRDRVWSTLPDSTRKPFGCALTNDPSVIIKPMLITEPTRKITRPELFEGDTE